MRAEDYLLSPCINMINPVCSRLYYLLLFSKLSQKIVAQNNNIYYLTVSLGQESGCWQDSVASALLDRVPQFLADCWLKVALSFLSHGSLHEAAFNIAVYVTRENTQDKPERRWKSIHL